MGIGLRFGRRLDLNTIASVPVDLVMKIPAGCLLLASTSGTETRRERTWTTGSGRREWRDGGRLSICGFRVTCIKVGAVSKAGICMRTNDGAKMNSITDAGDSFKSAGGGTVVLGNERADWFKYPVGFELEQLDIEMDQFN